MHLLRLDETPEHADNHHLAGTKPLFVNPLRHPARLGQVGALALVQLAETLITPSGGTLNLVFALIFFLLFLSTCVFPVPSSLLLALYFSVTCGIVPLHGSGELLCMAYMLGTLVYDTSLRLGFVMAIPVVIGIYVQSWRFPDTSWNLALNSAPVVTFLLLLILNFGQVNRNRSKLMEARLQTEHAQELTHRVEVARMIHDSVTGDLSNIARVSQRQLRQCDDPEQLEAWRQVNEQSRRVLDGMHAVIRQLSATDAGEQDAVGGDGEGLSDLLHERVTTWARRLAESGIRGDARVLDHLHRTMPFEGKDSLARQSCLLAMIDEAFTNIMRHGRRGDEVYTVAVTLGDRNAEIVSMNELSDGERDNGDIDAILDLPGGNGLRLHREEIEGLGGVLSVGEEDDSWVLYARVPYTDPEQGDSRSQRRFR